MQSFLLTVLVFGTQAALSYPTVVPDATSMGPTKAYQPAGGNKKNWSTLGCVTDLYPDDRALYGGYFSANDLTIGDCLKYCDTQGSLYAGLENANQCWCGTHPNSMSNLTVSGDQLTPKNNGGCSTPCAGNSTQNCGGSNRLLIFESSIRQGPQTVAVDNGDFLGCFADKTNARLLSTVIDGNSTAETVEGCLKKCNDAGLDLCGLEYSTQCFGASSSKVDLSKATKLNDNVCDYSCSGNRAELCGGAGALGIYQIQIVSPFTNPATISPNSTVSYSAQGCYNDRSDSQGRALTGSYSTSTKQTLEKCVAKCSQGNFLYAAAENGNECRCGNTLASFSKKGGATCDKACTGSSTESCGGTSYAMNLYKRDAATTTVQKA